MVASAQMIGLVFMVSVDVLVVVCPAWNTPGAAYYSSTPCQADDQVLANLSSAFSTRRTWRWEFRLARPSQVRIKCMFFESGGRLPAGHRSQMQGTP